MMILEELQANIYICCLNARLEPVHSERKYSIFQYLKKIIRKARLYSWERNKFIDKSRLRPRSFIERLSPVRFNNRFILILHRKIVLTLVHLLKTQTQ